MKKHTTKHALLMSALSLLVCVSMLVGATFAWFTDSVSSDRNIIQAGNLDVTLEYWDGDSYEDVTSSTKLFNDAALWEPGHAEVAYLRIDNAGSLALKYQLAVNVYNETTATNVAGEAFKLSDHLVFSVVEKKLTSRDDMFTREEAVAAAGNAMGLKSYNSGTVEMLPTDEADCVALIIYMPTSVGNEANYRGTAPTIELGTTLVATQMASEQDSWNENFDKDAWAEGFAVYNAEDLQAAINAGETNVTLMEDISLSETLVIPASAATYSLRSNGITLDLNGKKLTVANMNTIRNDGTNLTIKNGTVERTETAGGYAVNNVAGELVIENATIIGGVFTTGPKLTITNANISQYLSHRHGIYAGNCDVTINSGVFHNYNAGNATLMAGGSTVYTINGGTFSISDGRATLGWTSCMLDTSSGSFVINGGTFNGGARVQGTGTMTISGGTFNDSVGSNYTINGGTIQVKGGTFSGNNSIAFAKTYAPDGYKAVESDGICTVLKGDVVATDNASLSNALASGESNIALGAGEFTFPGATSGSVTISGTHDTVINIDRPAASDVTMSGVTLATNASYQGIQHAQKVVFENCVLTGNHFLYADYVLIKNCTINLVEEEYLWTYSAKNIEIIDSTFNTAGKCILMYNEGTDLVTNLTVKGCTFNATHSAIASGNVAAAIEIASASATNGHYTLTTENNIVDPDFSGEWRIKNCATNNTTVNGVVYNKLSEGLYKGTGDDLYIRNADGLIEFNQYMETNRCAHKVWGAKFTLLNDIDATGKTWNAVHMNVPNNDCIGFTFDGNGHTISNLTINGSMFHSTANGSYNDVATVFRNVTFDNVTVNGGYHTGIIWSQMYGDILLENVHVVNSNVTGMCNVGALIGRNGDSAISTIKFINCSVKNTTVTSTGGGDNCGASAFLGMALKAGSSVTLDLTFENCQAENNTLNSAEGHQGGGIYAIADVANETWNTPVVEDTFADFSNR